MTANLPVPFTEPEEITIGPAMAALTERQRVFVLAKLNRPGITDRDACILADLHPNGAGRIMASQKVLAALKEVASEMLHSGVLDAGKALIEIVRDPFHKDRFKAADRLLAQAGLGIISESKLTVTHQMSDKDKIGLIERLTERLGMSKAETKKLLGTAGVTKDAEFVEVSPATVALEEEWSV